MTGISYKKFSSQYNMKSFSGVQYGEVQGFLVTLSEGAGYKSASVCVSFPTPEVEQTLLAELYAPEMAKQYRLQGVQRMNTGVLTLVFYDNPGTLKRIQAFFDWFFPHLREIGAQGVSHCAICGQPFGELPGSLKFCNGVVMPVHDSCVQSVKREAAQEMEEFHAEPKQYGRGFFGGLLGGIVGAIPWAIVYYLGYFVGWLGLLIGFTVKKGYELLGGKPGRAKFWIILLITLLAVAFGQLLGDGIELAKAIADGDLPLFTYSQIPGLIIDSLIIDSDYLRATLLNFVIGVIFAMLGIFGILREVKQEGRVGEIEWIDVEPTIL